MKISFRYHVYREYYQITIKKKDTVAFLLVLFNQLTKQRKPKKAQPVSNLHVHCMYTLAMKNYSNHNIMKTIHTLLKLSFP